MPAPVINVRDALATFSERWSPKIVAALNDYHVKLAKLEGELPWHSHPETDELFLVVDGELELRFRDGNRRLRSGELCVVPRGVEHQPHAARECRVILIEPAGTTNQGDLGGTPGEWIRLPD